MLKLGLKQKHTQMSGRDETLATCLYTGTGEIRRSPIRITHFTYTIPARKILLDAVKHQFGMILTSDLPQEHKALLECNEEQSPDDLELAERMRSIQGQSLML